MAFHRTSIRFWVAITAMLSLWLGGCAAGLKQGTPEEAGVSSQKLQDVGAWFQRGVDSKEIPGAVVLIARHGRIAYFEPFGFRDREAGAPMTRDTIFRIASMTKPITSVAAMILVDQGRLSLSEPVSRYLPEFKDVQVGVERASAGGALELSLEPARQEMTVQDLLRHTSGLTYGFFGKSLVKDRYNAAGLFGPNLSLAEMTGKVARLPLQSQPGTVWDYSMSTDVLGRVVEVVSGIPLERFFAERIFAPLRMVDTSFHLTDPERIARLAQPQAFASSGQRPMLPDPSRKTWPSGGGGLVSTAQDYARFCQMLLNGGELDGVRLLSPATVATMMADQLAGMRVNGLPIPVLDVRRENGQTFGLGFAVRLADAPAKFPGTVGDASWVGLFGTQFWIDPKRDLFAIMLVQLAPPSATHTTPALYWQRMRELAYSALTSP